MKIIFLGYRTWAVNAIKELCKHPVITDFKIFTDHEKFIIEFNKNDYKDYLIIAIGWSWILQKEITNSHLCLGVHPSDLPYYRGGSPIQNQILNSITETKLSLFQLTHKIDEGDIFGKCDLSLAGDSITEIFKNLELSTILLLKNFLDKYPNIKAEKQSNFSVNTMKRRNHLDSKINYSEFKEDNLLNIYNKIRCLTDPYPNAYIEDKEGNRLYFKSIKFVKNGEK